MRNCYNCLFGGTGEELNDFGYCYKHNGENDFKQPPRSKGCAEWAEQLKPCPFCGSPATMWGEEDMVWAKCSNYDCQCSLITRFDEPEEAAEVWNIRSMKD